MIDYSSSFLRLTFVFTSQAIILHAASDLRLLLSKDLSPAISSGGFESSWT